MKSSRLENCDGVFSNDQKSIFFALNLKDLKYLDMNKVKK